MRSRVHILAAVFVALALGEFARGGYDSANLGDLKSGSSVALWLEADSGTFQVSNFTTPATANNDPVGGWLDQSPNGNNVTQGTAGTRPALKTSAINGKPAVDFASSKWMLSAMPFSPQPDMAVLAVCARPWATHSPDGALVMANAVTPTNAFGLWQRSDTQLGWAAGDVVVFGSGYTTTQSNRAITGSPIADADGAYLLLECYVGKYSAVLENGAVLSNATTAQAGTMSYSSVGGSNSFWVGWDGGPGFWDGPVAALVILTDSSPLPRSRVRHYLGSKYGISVP